MNSNLMLQTEIAEGGNTFALGNPINSHEQFLHKKPNSPTAAERQIQYQQEAQHEPMPPDAPSLSEIPQLFASTRLPFSFNPQTSKWEIENDEELRKVATESLSSCRAELEAIQSPKYGELNIATILFPTCPDTNKNADLFILPETPYEEDDENYGRPALTDDVSSNPLDIEFKKIVNWLKKIHPQVICCINITLDFYNLLLNEDWLRLSYEISDNEVGENTNEWNLFIASSIPIDKISIFNLPSTFRPAQNYYMLQAHLNLSFQKVVINCMKVSHGLDRKKQIQAVFQHIKKIEESIVVCNEMEESSVLRYASEEYDECWRLLEIANGSAMQGIDKSSQSNLLRSVSQLEITDTDTEDIGSNPTTPMIGASEKANTNIFRVQNDIGNGLKLDENEIGYHHHHHHNDNNETKTPKELQKLKGDSLNGSHSRMMNSSDLLTTGHVSSLSLMSPLSPSSSSQLLDVNDPKRNVLLMRSKMFQITDIEHLDFGKILSPSFGFTPSIEHCNASCVYSVRI